MKVAALQLNIQWENRDANFKRVRRFALTAHEHRADILVLPEMFSTGFSFNTAITAEPRNGPTVQFLSGLAKELNLNIIAGITLTAPQNRARNCAIVLNRNGEEVACYTKIKRFGYAGETSVHVGGTTPVTWQIDELNGSCFICYDLRFPSLFESISAGCNAIFVLASWPKERQQHFEILLSARAVENQLYVIGVNRVGKGNGLSYTGGTQIISPMGDILAHGGDTENLVFATLDLHQVHTIRQEMPFIKDR